MVPTQGRMLLKNFLRAQPSGGGVSPRATAMRVFNSSAAVRVKVTAHTRSGPKVSTLRSACAVSRVVLPVPGGPYSLTVLGTVEALHHHPIAPALDHQVEAVHVKVATYQPAR